MRCLIGVLCLAVLVSAVPCTAAKHEDRFKPKPKQEDGYYSNLQSAPPPAPPAPPPPPAPPAVPAEPPLTVVPPAEPPSAQPKMFMWKAVRGNEIVYLLGTIHVVSPKLYPLRPEIEQAFSGSKRLIVELKTDLLNTEKIKQLMKERSTYTAPDQLSKHLSPETKAVCSDYFTWAGEPMSLYEQTKPWMLSMVLSGAASRRQGFEGVPGIDHHLIKKAEETKKPIGELETPEAQIQLLSGFPDDMQDKMLRLNLLNLRNSANDYKDIERAWKAGDSNLMDSVTRAQLVKHPDLTPMYDKILTERNLRMADKIAELPKTDGPYFVAVGAAHMSGEKGLVALLKEKGYSVDQVAEAPRTPATTFGAARLQKFRFDDGECSLSFPGKPNMSYSDQLGTRSVQYGYPDTNGAYLLMYFNVPGVVPPARVQALYDSITASMTRSLKPSDMAQYPMAFPAGQGRQIDFSKLPFPADGAPPDSCARIRMLTAGKHVYMVGAFGRKAWLNSPIVNDYLNSFTVNQATATTRSPIQRSTSPSSSFNEDAEARRKRFEQERRESHWKFQRDSFSNSKRWKQQHGHGW